METVIKILMSILWLILWLVGVLGGAAFSVIMIYFAYKILTSIFGG